MDTSLIRNFCIIAHIDHGKSTLADRMLEITETVSKREMSEQHLDQMALEREKGITIKAQAVRMYYQRNGIVSYQLNLIDTPGHVDFSYEVSRSLAACEGAILVVDATQGIQAQTLANVYLALERDLTIIPVLNKIDLAVADPERVSNEMQEAFGFRSDEIVSISAKSGEGVQTLLNAVIERIPAPDGDPKSPLSALIFDSVYDSYRGVLAYVRVMNGQIKASQRILLMGSRATAEVLEVGTFSPKLKKEQFLKVGEVGYMATGLKNIAECRVGDTVTLEANPASVPLDGYRALKPMVFSGLYPTEPSQYSNLRIALEKLQLNDPSLEFVPEVSFALGPGFRCGFLGLLHKEIVQERLEREYLLDLIFTAPNVAYEVLTVKNEILELGNPGEFPSPETISEIREPWLELRIVTPSRYMGSILELMNYRRALHKGIEYLSAASFGKEQSANTTPSADARVLLEFEVPMSEVIADLYGQIKSRSQGYASIDYDFSQYKPAQLVRLDLLVNNEKIDAMSLIVHKDDVYKRGKDIVNRMRSLIPRQMFDVPIQAAVGSKIIARETIKALRKNVLSKCYGGDITRKRKLLEKQAEGKKRMKNVGKVEIPQEAFLAVMSAEEN